MSVTMPPDSGHKKALIIEPLAQGAIELWAYGTLYWISHHSASAHPRQVLEPVREERGRKLYRINAPGFYELLSADKLVRFECWKGILEVVES